MSGPEILSNDFLTYTVYNTIFFFADPITLGEEKYVTEL